jgi:hypothetical protein
VSYAVFVVVPGLVHRMGHGSDGTKAWSTLRRRLPDAVWEGDRLVCPGGVLEALDWLKEPVDGMQLAAAVCAPSVWFEGQPAGLEAHLGRRAAALARVGEVLLTPGVDEVVDGVGLFDAPGALVEAVGCPVRVARDYR